MGDVAALAPAQHVGLVGGVAGVFDHGVLAHGEEVVGFEAAELEVHARVAELHPHVVHAGVSVLLQQQRGTGGHEGVSVGGLGADVEFHAATHAQVAFAGVAGWSIDGVGVGGVELEVGIERQFGVGGNGGGTEGSNSGQFEEVLHGFVSGVGMGLN
ncbi:hypothetical protein D9M68_814740 [compost metagenome]